MTPSALLSLTTTDNNYDQLSLGKIEIDSGGVVVTDPLFAPESKPLSLQLQSGNFEVVICIEKDFGSVDHAAVIFSTEQSMRVTQHLAQDGKPFYYTVEAGMSCFMGATTQQEYLKELAKRDKKNPHFNSYDDYVAPAMRQADSMNWLNFEVDQHHHIAMFSSGGSDGVYPVYIFQDANKQITRLLTSFVIEEEQG